MVWDEPKRERNARPPPDGHGLDFAAARDRFEWTTALVAETYAGARGGRRFTAIGFLDGQLVALTFSPLGFGSDLRHQPAPCESEGAESL